MASWKVLHRGSFQGACRVEGEDKGTFEVEPCEEASFGVGTCKVGRMGEADSNYTCLDARGSFGRFWGLCYSKKFYCSFLPFLFLRFFPKFSQIGSIPHIDMGNDDSRGDPRLLCRNSFFLESWSGLAMGF